MNTSSKLKVVLSRLKNIRSIDNTYIAECPANKDHNVMIADVGNRVMVACHKGCGHVQLLDAIGFTWFELYHTKYDTTKDKLWLRKFRTRQMTEHKTHPLEIKEAKRLMTRISFYG